MEFRPVRPSRPTQVATTTQSQQRQAAAPQVAPDKPVAAQRAIPSSSLKTQKSARPSMWSIMRDVVIILAILGISGWFIYSYIKNDETGIDSSNYQAVFLTDGQVYFGKLQPFTDTAMKLTDVFYLQKDTSTKTESENPQKASTDQEDVSLIKLGKEIHGPQDEIVLMRDQVKFFENLKSDSKLAQSIKQYKKNHK